MSGTESSGGLPQRFLTPCFSTLGCGELDLEDALELAVRRRLPAVELRTLGGRNDLPDYFERRYGSPERLARAVAEYGVKIVSLDSSCDAIGTTPAGRAEVLALSPWAAAIGGPAIRVFDGGEQGNEAELGSMRELFDWWQGMDMGPQLIVETHDALAHPGALQRFIELYPSMGVLWDTHHTWKEGEERPSVTWSRLRGRTRHLHLKDSLAQGGYVVPGTGDYPCAELLEILEFGAFDGVVSLEWERHWYPDLPPIDQALDGFARVLCLDSNRDSS